MKALIAYDTKFGNTEKVAKTISEGLSASYAVSCKKVTDVSVSELRESDLVLVGSPTHAWNMSRATKSFFKGLGEERFEGKMAAAFDTKFNRKLAGSAAKKIEGELKKLGFKIAVPHLNAYVVKSEGPLGDGEIDRCKEFAAKLLESIK
jgi:flavodoxin